MQRLVNHAKGTLEKASPISAEIISIEVDGSEIRELEVSAALSAVAEFGRPTIIFRFENVEDGVTWTSHTRSRSSYVGFPSS